MNKIEHKLLNGNRLYIRKIAAKVDYTELLRKLVQGQHPYALIVTCSDSRVVPEIIFSSFLGELFVIRTAGNVINEGELASIEYGIEHLKIPYVLVLGHTHCGAVHAAIHKEKAEYLDCILDNISHSIGDECDEEEASKLNAMKQRDFIRSKFPNYLGEIKAAIYNIETKQVNIL